jgi:hypothetical protein
VLVKSWLLAIPHYLVVGFFAGGGSSGGLVTLLALIAAVSVLFTGCYPRGIFDFVVGMKPLGLPRRRLRRADDRCLPALPARPGRGGAGRRRAADRAGAGRGLAGLMVCIAGV